METQKIINLLNDSSNEQFKFATKKWYLTDCQTAKDKYNQNNSIKFETVNIKSSIFDYSDAIILVIRAIVVAANSNKDLAFKICKTIFYM